MSFNSVRIFVFRLVRRDVHNRLSTAYHAVMFLAICASLMPLFFKERHPSFFVFEFAALVLFVVDYLLRWSTADMQLPKYKPLKAFLVYPFTPLAVIDLLSILPTFFILRNPDTFFRTIRVFQALRIVRFAGYSKHLMLLVRVLYKERKALLSVLFIAVFFIFVSAVLMFNVEQSEVFGSFFDALYWATITLATIGYGDVVPATELGRLVAMVSALFGIALIALPSGIIAGSYMAEIKKKSDGKSEK